jgi:polar amino acid transport system permease protein
VIGASAHRWPRAVGIPLRAMSFLLSGVPFLVWLYWAHFPLQVLLHVVIDPFITASVLLSLINTVIVAEVWRSALNDFRQEYSLAATACGMRDVEILRFIKLPLAFRQALPVLLAVQVTMLQMTLFASLISVEELFRVAQRINSSIYKPVEIYTALAVFFVVICVPPYILAFWLRRRYTRDLSER